MRKLNNELFRRLHHWGCWRCRGIPGLGYPSETPESRLRTSPGRSEMPIARSPNYWPDRLAIETQTKISTIPNSDQLYLWCEYAQQMALTRAAEAMGVPVMDYRKGLDGAHKSIAEALNMKAWVYT